MTNCAFQSPSAYSYHQLKCDILKLSACKQTPLGKNTDFNHSIQIFNSNSRFTIFPPLSQPHQNPCKHNKYTLRFLCINLFGSYDFFLFFSRAGAWWARLRCDLPVSATLYGSWSSARPSLHRYPRLIAPQAVQANKVNSNIQFFTIF